MSSWLWSIYYGVRSPPKFIVWILNSSFKFLNFYLNFIAEYNILHSSFRFRITGKRFYTRLLFFKLNSFIWPCSPYIFNSLHQITLAESYFKLDLENFQHDFWIFVHASVIVDQDHLLGRGSWMALLVHHALRLLYKHGGSVRTCCCTRNFGAFRFLSGRWL